MRDRSLTNVFSASPLDGFHGPPPAPNEAMTTSSTGGQKSNKLARFDLIPPAFLWELSTHYGKRGGNGDPATYKYAERNWELGYPWSRSFTALSRHLFEFRTGALVDLETQTPHIVAVAWHAAALHTYSTDPRYVEFNDLFGGNSIAGVDSGGN